MKAIVYTKYGSPDVLQLKEVEKPVPRENEVLVKIHAAALNAADFEIMRGEWTARVMRPLKPKYKIPGSDIAGRVKPENPSLRNDTNSIGWTKKF